ncbi:MAG: acylglycerol kinase family protein, partial [Candidatus Nanosyncoccus sp. P13S_S20_bin.18.1]|nr:acylglycerol kinase family protein [Candidatus Nanosyncoccus sp. P13S_S20_bin.18.1]
MSKKADLEHIRERLAALAGTRTRVILVCNRKSTGYKRVEKEVVTTLREFILQQKGITFLRFDVESPTLEENAKRLANLIGDGDVVLVAGGDGTAGIGVNGIMQSGKDAKFYVIPYGNFNDIIQILRSNSGKKVFPIEALIDGKHFRYALAYFTLGMMAESTKIFDDEKVRRKLRKSKFNLIFSLKTLLMWFFVNRKKDYITIDGQKYSDILVVNGKNVARLM